ncbi:MAG: SirB2 family protein [Burkholderiales bacterium]|nr:SirB2 family protein [Bacteroidia bacterium]
MATGMLHSHYLFVVLFTLIYLIKTILLLSDRDELLEKFKKKTKVLEIIVSFGFLATGVFLMFQMPHIPTLMYVKIGLVVLSIPLAVVGYKKKNKVLATLSFFLIVVSFGIAQKVKKEKAGGTILAMSGKEIFEEKCTLCHGGDGKLGMSGSKDLSVTQLDHAGIVTIVTVGKNTMASYKSTLSAEQIEAVASYIETDIKGK